MGDVDFGSRAGRKGWQGWQEGVVGREQKGTCEGGEGVALPPVYPEVELTAGLRNEERLFAIYCFPRF